MHGPIRARIGLLMVAALGIVLLTASVFATIVTNTNDNGAGSLREALLITPAGGVIEFSLSNCPCTITLTFGELFIDKDITVKGPGADMLTISAGGNQFRVLRIEGPPDLGYIKVGIDGIRIANGKGGTDGSTVTQGGGIFNKNADTTILNSVIENNYAVIGGGAVNRDGVLNIISSSVTGNNSHSGGGVGTYNGTLIISDSRFTDNHATGSMGAGGGAIYGNASVVTVLNTTVSRNSGVWAGGLWLLSGSTADITHSTFDNNEAVSTGAIGSSGLLQITNSTISGNKRGSVYANGPTNITSSTIVFNTYYTNMGGAVIPGGLW